MTDNPQGASDCWIWAFAKDKDGYGVFRQTRAHRMMYEAFVGVIPTGLFVLHRCDNPPCVNPEHLFLGTNLDNMRDMAVKGRGHKTNPFWSAKTHCPRNHEYSSNNTRVDKDGGRHCIACDQVRSHHVKAK